MNVSGISGVATKTTSLLALFYLLFERKRGAVCSVSVRIRPGPSSSLSRTRTFPHDRPNRRFTGDDARRWQLLVPEDPGPQRRRTLVPPRPGSENVVRMSGTRVQPGGGDGLRMDPARSSSTKDSWSTSSPTPMMR